MEEDNLLNAVSASSSTMDIKAAQPALKGDLLPTVKVQHHAKAHEFTALKYDPVPDFPLLDGIVLFIYFI